MLEGDSVLVKTFDDEWDRETKLSREEAIELMRSDAAKGPSGDSVGSPASASTTSSVKLNPPDAPHTAHSAGPAGATFANVKIRFAMVERPPANARRRIEVRLFCGYRTMIVIDC